MFGLLPALPRCVSGRPCARGSRKGARERERGGGARELNGEWDCEREREKRRGSDTLAVCVCVCVPSPCSALTTSPPSPRSESWVPLPRFTRRPSTLPVAPLRRSVSTRSSSSSESMVSATRARCVSEGERACVRVRVRAREGCAMTHCASEGGTRTRDCFCWDRMGWRTHCKPHAAHPLFSLLSLLSSLFSLFSLFSLLSSLFSLFSLFSSLSRSVPPGLACQVHPCQDPQGCP